MAEELNIAEITVAEFFNAVGDGTLKSKASKTQAKNILKVLNKEKYNFDTNMKMEEFNKNKTIHILLKILSNASQWSPTYIHSLEFLPFPYIGKFLFLIIL